MFLDICVFEKTVSSTARLCRVQRSGDKPGSVGAVNIRAHRELAVMCVWWMGEFNLYTNVLQILLAFFYLMIDLVQLKRWAMPFVWIGMNPIAIYLLSTVLDFNHIAGRVLSGPIADWANGILPGLGALLVAVGGMFLIFWLCRTLYKRNVFFRI